VKPKWLTTQEQEVWRAFLSLDNHVRKAITRQLAEDSDMPAAYYEILVQLSEAPGRTLRMSALAAATEGSQSQLSHAVNRLEERGWVSRTRCREDGRGWFACLTDEGMQALVDAAPGHVNCVRKTLFDPLTEQQQQALLEIARTVLDAGQPAP
jgi:DNA-binding MarR family transcriptional regulator